MKSLNSQRALVVFSGGQDSTTCLWWALKKYTHVEAVTFDYGQRHRVELESAKAICELASVKQHVLPINVLGDIGDSPLVDSHTELVNTLGDDGLPATFVPGRNLVFLTLAGALAYRRDCGVLVTGVCETDYSGYPDCRQPAMSAQQETLRQGMECDMKIETPLMSLTKAQTVELAKELGALEALALSHTCYEGSFPPCGKCDACTLRAKGFAEAKIDDPLMKRTNSAK